MTFYKLVSQYKHFVFFWNTESDILSKKNTFHLLTKEAHLHIDEGPVFIIIQSLYIPDLSKSLQPSSLEQSTLSFILIKKDDGLL